MALSHPDWRADLAASRDLSPREQQAFGRICSWFENWRLGAGISVGEVAGPGFLGRSDIGQISRTVTIGAMGRSDVLVAETKVNFATRKQALNAMVFFYKDVCGKEKEREEGRPCVAMPKALDDRKMPKAGAS